VLEKGVSWVSLGSVVSAGEIIRPGYTRNRNIERVLWFYAGVLHCNLSSNPKKETVSWAPLFDKLKTSHLVYSSPRCIPTVSRAYADSSGTTQNVRSCSSKTALKAASRVMYFGCQATSSYIFTNFGIQVSHVSWSW